MSSELWWKINKPSAEAGATGEKHTPVLNIAGEAKPGATVQVTVDVGEGKHPNEAGHFIQWVELRINELPIARAEFSAGITRPVVTFNVVLPTEPVTLTAIERCNMHGIWESLPAKIA